MTLEELRRVVSDQGCFEGLLSTGCSETAGAKADLAQRVLHSFCAAFDARESRQVFVHFVPGRIEVLGKHTDYCGGHSLLTATDRGFLCISALNDCGAVRMVEADPHFSPCEFPVAADLTPQVGLWPNYPMTMAKRLVSNFGGKGALRGVDVAFGCDLPIGGGMSGSSALMIMTYFALAVPNGLTQTATFQRNIADNLDLAMYLACCENGQTFRELVGGKGVGTFGGSEDHTEILNARAGHLSLFRFCPTVAVDQIPFPSSLSMVVAHSGLVAEKTGEAMEKYNLVSRRTALLVETMNKANGWNYTLLRDIADELAPRGREGAVAFVGSSVGNLHADLDLPGRFRQFFVEDREIIPAVADRLRRKQTDGLGELVDLSHANSRRHLWNILPEVDFLQQSARELGAVAASGFGAGFGGSVYALVESEKESEFLTAWFDRYRQRFPGPASQATFFVSQAAGAACRLFGS